MEVACGRKNVVDEHKYCLDTREGGGGARRRSEWYLFRTQLDALADDVNELAHCARGSPKRSSKRSEKNQRGREFEVARN